MKKVVLKLSITDEKEKKKAMMIVSGIGGIESITVDMKDKRMTVIGNVDEVILVSALRKLCSTHIVSVGLAKEKKDTKKGDGGNKKGDGAKKDSGGGKKGSDNKKVDGAKKDGGGGTKGSDKKKKEEFKILLTYQLVKRQYIK